MQTQSDSRAAMLQQRYMMPDEQTEGDMWRRVAHKWARNADEAEQFFEMFSNLDGLCNTPAIINAGKPVAQGSACFVMGVEDSLWEGDSSIMRTLGEAARIHATGGGTGFYLGNIRPKGSMIKSTGKPSPMGPVGVMEIYSEALQRITQGSVRWGANMAVLNDDHPDIMEFVGCKAQEFEEDWADTRLKETLLGMVAELNGHGGRFRELILAALAEYFESKQMQGRIHNFNISVGASDEFMQIGRRGAQRELWRKIVEGAWLNGEPGLLFLDRINRMAPHPEKIYSTNPCGEVPLLPNEACVLGSINLENHIRGGDMDYDKLDRTVRTMTRLLDNIVDLQDYPLEKIRQTHHRYRKIGVGIMGLANAFIHAGVRYGSRASLGLARSWMGFVQEISWDESRRLADERGTYPGYRKGLPYRRNIVCQVIAPTGSISRLAKTSFGIEPNYAKVQESFILNSSYIDEHPLRDNEHFITADEVPLHEHIEMLGAIQEFTDQAVSKTCNAAEDTTPEQIEQALLLAYEVGAKGITVLRKGGRQRVVLKDHSGKHDRDADLPENKHKFVCVGGSCET